MQFEFPWALGPADGRYLLRDEPQARPAHVLVLATLGAPERRRLRARRDRLADPAPAPVTTARATVVEAEPVAVAEAERWLAASGAPEAERALAQVARAVRAHRVAAADPAAHEPALRQALVVRLGHGAGEQVAEGRWSAARELVPEPGPRRRRSAALRPQERLAELLGAHAQPLACEELALRARHDLDRGQLREAALELRGALDAAALELSGDPHLTARVERLGADRATVETLAQAALRGAPPDDAQQALADALGRLEAALRARIARLS